MKKKSVLDAYALLAYLKKENGHVSVLENSLEDIIDAARPPKSTLEGAFSYDQQRENRR